VHPDGERVATGGTDRAIKLWKWGSDQPLAAFPAHGDWVRVLAFSPDGRLLASAGDDRLVKLWDVETAREVATLEAGTSYLDALAWSLDGSLLHAAGNDGIIHTWRIGQNELAFATDVDNRREVEDESLNGGYSYPGGVRGMAVSPDGKLLAAVGLTSLNVLDAADGKELLKQPGRGFGVAFHPSNEAGPDLAITGRAQSAKSPSIAARSMRPRSLRPSSRTRAPAIRNPCSRSNRQVTRRSARRSTARFSPACSRRESSPRLPRTTPSFCGG
jgi:WD40 repeat protein